MSRHKELMEAGRKENSMSKQSMQSHSIRDEDDD